MRGRKDEKEGAVHGHAYIYLYLFNFSGIIIVTYYS